jgi:membrane protein
VGIGAGITALLFVLSKFLIGLYLAKSSIGSVYGPAGSLVLLLAWIYYASLVFLFGAEFAAVYAHRHGSRATRDGAAHHRAWRGPPGGAPLERRVTRTAMYHGPQES